eukprot:5045120-Prymnesium_polylepis.1
MGELTVRLAVRASPAGRRVAHCVRASHRPACVTFSACECGFGRLYVCWGVGTPRIARRTP